MAWTTPLNGFECSHDFIWVRYKATRLRPRCSRFSSGGSAKFLNDYRPEKLWAYIGIFAEAVRDGQARGLVREDVDPFLQMWGFFGALDELGTQWVLAKRGKIEMKEAANQVAEVFIRGLAASPSTKEST